jgi:LCP family protein required for cell wall assembly
MRKHKKNQNKSEGLEGIVNTPQRSSRNLIGGSPQESLNNRRMVNDFSRPNGYHPSQPRMSGPVASEEAMAKKDSMINMTLPGELAEHHPKKIKKDGVSLRTILHRIKQGVLVVGAIILIIGGVLIVKGIINLHKIFGGSPTGLQAIVSPSALHTEGDGNINVLILGIGGAGHDGPDLTDTILLASMDPVNHKAYLVSVPRDLWVNVPGEGPMKLNSAYETAKWKYLGNESDSNQNHNAIEAGFNLDNKLIGGILGVPIKYDVLVDFQAFQQAIDTMGGVTINVPTELYDPTIEWQNNYNPVIAEPGIQTFTGAKALLYVRSRETTSDFARTERQRQVIVAVKDKALTVGTISNPVKLAQLSDEFGNNVVTNLSLGDANTLYGIVKNMSDSQIKSIGLADPPNDYVTTTEEYGQSVVEPTAGPDNYTAIQGYIRSTVRDGYLAKENANIMILNGSPQANLGTAKANLLKSYGYNVGYVGNAPTQNYKKTVLVDLSGGADKYTAHYLENRLGAKTTTHLPDSSIQPGTAKFVIILGQDEAINS